MPVLRIDRALLRQESLPPVCVMTGSRENVRWHTFKMINRSDLSSASRYGGLAGAMAEATTAGTVDVSLYVSERALTRGLPTVRPESRWIGPAAGFLLLMGVVLLRVAMVLKAATLVLIAALLLLIAVVATAWLVWRNKWYLAGPTLLGDDGDTVTLMIPSKRAHAEIVDALARREAARFAAIRQPSERPSNDPERALQFRTRAEQLAAEGKLDEALYQMERATSADASDTDLKAYQQELSKRVDIENYRKLSERHAQNGKTGDAIELLERLLRLAPDHAPARARLDELRLSKTP